MLDENMQTYNYIQWAIQLLGLIYRMKVIFLNI